MAAYFGPAGNSDSFSQRGYKKNIQIPTYLAEFSLGAYEYQCGRGVRVNEKAAKEFAAAAKAGGIRLSLHAPYYISLSSVEPEKREKSVGYILDSARAADWLGAERIVVHSGSCSKMTREQALDLAKDTLLQAQKVLDEEHLGHIRICPETMGKINQLGTFEEVMELCQVDERFVPCIDFGHLNARTLGQVNSKEAFEAILDGMKNLLGEERAGCFHSHFSKIEYTEKGGEKRHLTFEDTQFGPDFGPLALLIAQYDLSPTFICESAGTQAEDAKMMQDQYLAAVRAGKGETR
ncbi:MAG: TIM barrel protein [Massiliimalia sp.]|jgi:deoxyribonuclease-4